MTHDVSFYRTLLENERVALTQNLNTHGESVGTDDWDASAKNTDGEEADFADTADHIEELVTNVPLVAELEARLHEVDDALAKIEAGTYGTCEVCNEAIAPERLTANPAAKTCVAHA